MPGTIDWTATFIADDSDVEIYAEIYDKEGGVVQSKRVPCSPPVNCPFLMEDVPFGRYTAALVSNENRYFYVDGDAPITTPNDADHASAIDLSSTNSNIPVNIYVDPD